MSDTVKIANGLLKAKLADITEDGSYGTPYAICDLTEMSAETSESSVSLPAGNRIIYSKSSIGKTNGSISFYDIYEEVKAKIFDTKVNRTGGVLYSTKANVGYKVLIIEQTVVNSATGLESTVCLIFPKVSLGKSINEAGSTKDADGNETNNTKSLSFEAMSLDSGVYKLVQPGECPATITAALFTAVEG